MDKTYLFDIDGVLTSPYSKKINLRNIQFIKDSLKSGLPILLYSGRSFSWVEENILPSIKEGLDVLSLDNLMISCEYGGVTVNFENGIQRKKIHGEIDLPIEVKNSIKNLMGDTNGIFYDSTKETMVTVEMIEAHSDTEIKEYNKALDRILIEINSLLKDYLDIKAFRTTLDVDVLNKKASKGLSAKDFLLFLKSKQISIDSFSVFGDSPSDIDAAKELSNEGKEVVFYYVGSKELKESRSFQTITATKGRLYDEAVSSFLGV